MALISLNPATGQVIAEYAETPSLEVEQSIQGAHRAHLEWKKTSFPHRAKLMTRAASILRDRAREFGELMTMEMGKPVAGGVAEAEKCAWVCDYYAEEAERNPRRSAGRVRALPGASSPSSPWV